MQIKTTMRYDLTPVRMVLSKRQEITNTGEDVQEGNGTPLQYYCLENPMDGGAW